MGTLDLEFCNLHICFCFQLQLPLYSDSHGISGRRPAKGSLFLAQVFSNSETELPRLGLRSTALSAKHTPYAASGTRFGIKS